MLLLLLIMLFLLLIAMLLNLLLFLIIDMFISWTALFRSAMRRNNIEPITPVGRLYDKIYPDSVLSKSFPNMDFKVRKGK